MPNKLTNNKRELKQKRKDLRNNATPAEVLLWRCLKRSQLGYKFRRQHSIGFYILDFYCPTKRLAIELDGAHHFTPEGVISDRKRDSVLKEQGITVLRFENKLVFEHTLGVLDTILERLQEL